MGANGVLKELPAGTALLTAGVQYRPDTCIPLSAHLRTAALCNFPVDDQLAYALLSAIIRRRHGSIKQEVKDCITMFAKTFCQGKRLGRQIILLCQRQNSPSDFQHHSVKSVFGNLFTLMPEMKQSLKLYQQGLSKAVISLVGQGCQELDISNQMRQTELLKPVGIFDIGAVEVAHNRPAVRLTEDFFEDFRRPRFGDTKEAEYRRTKDPCPILDTLIFPAGLIDIQNRLRRDMFAQFFIRCCKCIVEAIDNIAQMAACNIYIQNFLEKGLQATIRGMERAFHITDQRLQTGAKQLAFDNAGRQFSPDNSSAFGTDETIHTVFGDGERLVIKLYRLLHLGFFDWIAITRIPAITAISIQWDGLVNLFRLKGLPIDTLMSGLTALTRRTIGLFGLGRFNNIRGGRLGRVGRILREAGDLVGEFGHLLSKFGIDFKKFGNLFFKFRNALNVKLFFSRSQFSSSCHLLWLLSGECGSLLEKIGLVSLNYDLESVLV